MKRRLVTLFVCAALAAAGMKEIEVGSFVPPRVIPQMADTSEVVRRSVTLPGLTVIALVPINVVPHIAGRVFYVAPCVLDLTLYLVHGAFILQTLIAGPFAGANIRNRLGKSRHAAAAGVAANHANADAAPASAAALV